MSAVQCVVYPPTRPPIHPPTRPKAPKTPLPRQTEIQNGWAGQGVLGRGPTVLADGSHVDSRGGSNAAVAGDAGLKVTVDTANGKLA